MIPINRDSVITPNKLSQDTEKRKFYLDLYDSEGAIRSRWNTIQENGIRVVRERLREMSKGCCAYCGKKIKGSDMDVDHFLPSHHFQYLSYCWDNFLPSCKKCNQNYKNKFIPVEFKDKLIIEKCMISDVKKFDYIYDKETILKNLCVNGRIIDPTFDDVESHIVFNPEFYMYETKSSIGENTKEMFFDKYEFIEDLEKISNIVRRIVEKDCSYDFVMDQIDLYGYEFYYNKFYDYWKKEKANGRLK
jgi:uncharacterized protein (TIGR02646 family)